MELQDEIEYAEPDILAQYKQNYGSFYIGLTQVSTSIKYSFTYTFQFFLLSISF